MQLAPRGTWDFHVTFHTFPVPNGQEHTSAYEKRLQTESHQHYTWLFIVLELEIGTSTLVQQFVPVQMAAQQVFCGLVLHCLQQALTQKQHPGFPAASPPGIASAWVPARGGRHRMTEHLFDHHLNWQSVLISNWNTWGSICHMLKLVRKRFAIAREEWVPWSIFDTKNIYFCCLKKWKYMQILSEVFIWLSEVL